MDVPAFFRWFETLASSFGFRTMLHGSVLRDGVGRDVDVVILPRRHVQANLNGLLQSLAGVVTGVAPAGVFPDGQLFSFALNGGYEVNLMVLKWTS